MLAFSGRALPGSALRGRANKVVGNLTLAPAEEVHLAAALAFVHQVVAFEKDLKEEQKKVTQRNRQYIVRASAKGSWRVPQSCRRGRQWQK